MEPTVLGEDTTTTADTTTVQMNSPSYKHEVPPIKSLNESHDQTPPEYEDDITETTSSVSSYGSSMIDKRVWKFALMYKMLLEDAHYTARLALFGEKLNLTSVENSELDQAIVLLFHKQLLFFDEINRGIFNQEFDLENTGLFYHIYEAFEETAKMIVRTQLLLHEDDELPIEEQVLRLDNPHSKVTAIFYDQAVDLDDINTIILEMDFARMKTVNMGTLQPAFLRYAQMKAREILSYEEGDILTDEQVIKLDEVITYILLDEPSEPNDTRKDEQETNPV